jgi:23S rRNA (guanosine2251-2'-O)-methyltransferase
MKRKSNQRQGQKTGQKIGPKPGQKPDRNASSPMRGPQKGAGAKRSVPASRTAPRNQHGQRTQNAGKEINPLRDGARWVVGIHSCEETLIMRPKKIREIWLREDYMSSESLRHIADHAAKQKVPVQKKSAGQLDMIGSGHQGVALAALSSPELDWSLLAKDDTKHIVLILDGLEDPHNLGSILRTAWLVGAKAILIPEDRAVGLTPTVCKIASGGAEHVPVEQHSNLASIMQKLKDAGFWIYGLSEKGKRKPWEFELPNKVAWVVGNEGSGLRITTERACDELVRIPQVESGSSYNASIALAMALTETCRQLGQPD